MRIKFCLESLEGRDQSEDLGVDGRIILKSILRTEGWRVWIGFIWLGIGTGVAGDLPVPQKEGTS
jgi:hypothetical protein